MSDIPHIGFIVAAYGVTFVTLAGTIIALVLDNRSQKRLLSKFSRHGEGL